MPRSVRLRLKDHVDVAIHDYGDPACYERVSDATVGEIMDAIREIDRLRLALEMIAGRKQCVDNLMGNDDIAIAALDWDEEYEPCHLTENG